MTLEELRFRVSTEGIVPMDPSEWSELAGSFEEVERHDTRLAGNLIILRDDDTFLAVEEPSRQARVIRKLGGRAEAAAFVTKRMEEYERMWDGCGCRVEYYR